MQTAAAFPLHHVKLTSNKSTLEKHVKAKKKTYEPD